MIRKIFFINVISYGVIWNLDSAFFGFNVQNVPSLVVHSCCSRPLNFTGQFYRFHITWLYWRITICNHSPHFQNYLDFLQMGRHLFLHVEPILFYFFHSLYPINKICFKSGWKAIRAKVANSFFFFLVLWFWQKIDLWLMPWDLGLMTYTNIYDYEREVLVQFQIQQQIKDIQIQQVLSYLLSTL